jgi:hypothetical protein
MEHNPIPEKVMTKGVFSAWLIHPDSLRVLAGRRIDNLIVNEGKKWLAARAAGSTGQQNLTAIAVGTGNTAPVVGDTALSAQLASASLVRAPWQGFGTDSNKIFARAFFDTDEAIGTLAEAGLFFGSVLFSRVLISPTISKPSGSILVCQWEISF